MKSESITSRKPLDSGGETVSYTLTAEHICGRFNLATAPTLSATSNLHGEQLVESVRIDFLAGHGRPLVEVSVLVDLPDYVQSYLYEMCEAVILRHMVAESLCPDRPTHLD